MPRVTVIVPTAARPETLETTLRGIARQTATSQIAEVIVSENLGDERSRSVCARFPDLPITYKLREPSLGNMMQHAAKLFEEVRTEIVAFVCDDDVWAPGHLQSALDSLDRHPEAIAHFSGFIAAESEFSLQGAFWAPSLVWLVAGRPPRWSEYVMRLSQVLQLAWVITPFQWSTLVARSDAASVSASALTDSPHFFYADRLFITALAHHGVVIFDPSLDTLYRVYEGNWARGQEPELLSSLLSECEALVLEDAESAGVDVPALWRQSLSQMPSDIASDVEAHFRARFSQTELDAHRFTELLPAPLAAPSLAARLIARLKRAGGALMGKAV